MKLPLVVLGSVCALTLATAHPAHAGRNYPWCAYYLSPDGLTDCAFATFQQCMATVSGVGGYCNLNPYLEAYSEPPHRYPYHRHHRRYDR